MKNIFILLAVLFLQACSSNVKKGDNMMNAEQYDQAVLFYQKANQNNPGDEEIAQKLFQARSRMVAANLIQVRLFRQSDQLVNAAQLLDLSLWHLDTWKVMADSGVKATIDEEVRYASRWLNNYLTGNAKRNEINMYFYQLKRYKNIIKTGLIDQTITNHQPAMLKQGKLLCEKMKGQLNQHSHYLVDVWKNYCANFSMAVEYALKADSSRYSGISIKANGLKIDRDLSVSSASFSQKLFTQLEDNIWFSPLGAQNLSVDVSGDIEYAMKVSPHEFTKKYTTEKKTYEVIKDPKNPDKEKLKVLKVEKIKNEAKFKGLKYIETVNHNLQVNAYIASERLSGSEYSPKKQSPSYAHSVYFKEAGIKPLQPNLLNKDTWLKTLGHSAINDIEQKMNAAWVASNCAVVIASVHSTFERAARCAQLQPDHATVAAWSQQQFALTYPQLKVLLN